MGGGSKKKRLPTVKVWTWRDDTHTHTHRCTNASTCTYSEYLLCVWGWSGGFWEIEFLRAYGPSGCSPAGLVSHTPDGKCRCSLRNA